MTKLESADIIIKQKGSCVGVYNCDDCFNNKSTICNDRFIVIGEKFNRRCLQLAIKYKKEHENESK